MKNWLRYTLNTLLWICVVAYILFAALRVRSQRTTQKVASVEIEIVDSSAVNSLVSRSMVEGWIKKSKIRTTGESLDSVQLTLLERYISDNGFVAEAKCYTTYSGVLRVEVSQLRPVIRLLLDGFNSYVTSDGYIFQRPVASSRYVPVVTGSYSPLFTAGYSGTIHELYDVKYEEIESEINRVEVKNLYPLYAERIKIREELKKVNSRYTRRRFGESSAECDKRVAELKELNSRDRAKLTRAAHDLNEKIEREKQKQKVYRDRQKKLQKKYQDFINLITFVDVVENDKFWSSEIVQIVATATTNGDLQLELIPRSGDHTIIFGEVIDVEERLNNVRTLYKEVLPNVGWHEFKSINVEYQNQIVCK
ncbi:MAG: hypothetical protein R3Y08_07600 [Rikenellaceae bacterium]